MMGTILSKIEKDHIKSLAEKTAKKDKDGNADSASIEKFSNRDRSLSIGDLVKVHYKIVEGKRERIQIFEGYVVAVKGSGNSKSFKVRKISYGVGVERLFPLHSPQIDKIELVRSGKVRRSRLYYLRDLSGKAARIESSQRKWNAETAEKANKELVDSAKPEEAQEENPKNS